MRDVFKHSHSVYVILYIHTGGGSSTACSWCIQSIWPGRIGRFMPDRNTAGVPRSRNASFRRNGELMEWFFVRRGCVQQFRHFLVFLFWEICSAVHADLESYVCDVPRVFVCVCVCDMEPSSHYRCCNSQFMLLVCMCVCDCVHAVSCILKHLSHKLVKYIHTCSFTTRTKKYGHSVARCIYACTCIREYSQRCVPKLQIAELLKKA